MKKIIKIGKHSIQIWLIIIPLISVIGAGVLTYHVWNTLIIPLTVKEPIEILNYPSELSFFPDETEEFNITVQNHASVNYSVILDFSLDNTTYQENYVTFSNEIYTVVSGEQNLTAWVKVEPYASPIIASLTIDFKRGNYPYGLVGYWRFDEGTGTTAGDSSGNDNNGTIYGATWVDGKYGKALQFDGVDDYVEVPDDASLRPSAFTVEAWIKGDKLGALGTWQHIVSKHERYDGTPFRGYVLQVNELRLGFSLGNGSAWNHIVDPETYEIGVWYHLIATWDGTTQKFYINGTLQSSATPTGFENTTYPLRFGRRSEDIDPARIYSGIIDEVRIYNRALNAEEVEAQYTSLLP